MIEFIIGAVLLVFGLTIFLAGADIGVLPMGELMGSSIMKSRKLWFVVVISFIIGFMVTIAEPDVQVLASMFNQVAPGVISIPAFIAMIAIGVGLFLVIALLRIIFKFPLSKLLLISYIIVFIVAAFTSPNFLSVSFDSGGVTTGPMTVPFILALGVGVTRVMGTKEAEEDSFGLVGLSSVGPILFLLILGIIFRDAKGVIEVERHVSDSIIGAFLEMIPEIIGKVFVALLPITVIFIIFQQFVFKLPKKQVVKISLGLLYTFIGLVLFLVGVEGGFMGAAMEIGMVLGSASYRWVLIPVGAALGFVVVFAEPAVRVLTVQVENVSGGYIGKTSMLIALSIGVAISVALSMVRVIVGFKLWWYIIPGYIVALILMKYSPPLFTSIAFDSGGVASGPMTATFILAMAQGAALATGADIMQDAFGVVAMVAMTPLITIQILGVLMQRQQHKLLSNTEDVPEKSEV